MYAIVPAVEGVPSIGQNYLYEGRSITPDKAAAYLEGTLEEGWTQLADIEYLSFWKAGKLSADKTTIKPDGLDTATIITEVHPDLTEITFYHADTHEPIATVPVDPATHTATLQVTATTPGVIKIRAGEPTITRLNEVVITAQ